MSTKKYYFSALEVDTVTRVNTYIDFSKVWKIYENEAREVE